MKPTKAQIAHLKWLASTEFGGGRISSRFWKAVYAMKREGWIEATAVWGGYQVSLTPTGRTVLEKEG